METNKIKNKHIVIIAGGSSLRTYKKEIISFINKKRLITIGCNNVSNIFSPNYILWSEISRYIKYGHLMKKTSIPIFDISVPQKIIKIHWNKEYISIRTRRRRSKTDYRNKLKQPVPLGFNYKQKIMYGFFRTGGTIAIFWTYIQGAKKVSIVGMDGYTFFSEKELQSGKGNTHCFGHGFTDQKEKTSHDYEFQKQVDIDTNNTLIGLQKYFNTNKKKKFKFEIITPTIYNKFYNPDTLNLKNNRN